MDVTSLVGPVLRLVGATVNNKNNLITSSMNQNSSNGSATLDRTLGAAATLGITVALYRFITTSSSYSSVHHPHDSTNDNAKKKFVTVPVTLLHSFLQVILKGFFEKHQQEQQRKAIRSVTDDNSYQEDTDATSYNDNHRTIVNHRGFCHCRSISFTLKAPKQIIAKDSSYGRIGYPHYNTTESQFHLHPQSDEYVSIYYTMTHDKNKIAAHVFCKRCGVHILRAPDSNTCQLQINVNCLLMHPSNIKILPNNNTNNSECENDALDSGVAMEHQWENNDSMHGDHEDDEEPYLQGKHGNFVQSNLHKTFFGSSSSFPGTSSTSATTISPLQESILPPLSSDDDDDEEDDETSTWDPSTIVSNQNKEESSSSDLEGSLATFATRDQLKYYMTKHLKNGKE